VKIENINFQKVFLLFFAALLLFSALSFAFAASDGGWTEAVQLEQHRLETRSRAVYEEQTRGGHGRHFRHARMASQSSVASTEAEAGGISDEGVAARRGVENHLLRGVARTYVRVTLPEFGVFDVFGFLFRAVFTLLLALWVYVDSKKHGRNVILWTAIAAVASIFGLIVYLIVHRRRGVPAAAA